MAVERNSEYVWISIHAPLAGSDVNTARCVVSLMDFNPRSPCGERHEVHFFGR